MIDTTQTPPAVFDSRFQIDQRVALVLAHVVLPARVLAVAFLAGKVLYTLAVYTGYLEPDLAEQYGLTNALGWDADGAEYIRVPNIDSIFVEDIDPATKPATDVLTAVTARLAAPRLAPIETARKKGSGVTINAEIYCSNEDTAATIANWLAAVARNCAVGHSATVAAFFDGDGADYIDVKGLPDNAGAEMADAGGNWGDDLMLHVGPHSAQAYGSGYATTASGDSVETLRKKTVWPAEKADKE